MIFIQHFAELRKSSPGATMSLMACLHQRRLPAAGIHDSSVQTRKQGQHTIRCELANRRVAEFTQRKRRCTLRLEVLPLLDREMVSQ